MLCKCSAFTGRVLLLIASLCLCAPKILAQPNEQESFDTIQSNNMEITPRERDEILAQIQAQLQLIESSRDAYDIGISELSLELGAHFAELGYYDQSLEAYRRALHIARINYGLTSEQQLPILEQFLSLYEEAGLLTEVDVIFEKMLLIHQENYDPWSPAMANLYERIGNWHLAAYYYEIDESPISHLIAANVAFTNARNIGRAQRGYSYDFNIYNLLSVTNWGLSTFYVAPNSSNNFSNEEGNYSREASAHIHIAFRNGLYMLSEGIEAANETGDPEKMTRAALMYADWNQLFNRPRTAREHYVEAYNHSLQLEPENPLRQSFSTPHPLPNFDESNFVFKPVNVDNHEIALAFDVTEWGRPQSISVDDIALENKEVPEEVSEVESQEVADTNVEDADTEEVLSPEELERQRVDAERRAINTIRHTRFRPAFVNGQPSDYQNVKQVIMVAKET